MSTILDALRKSEQERKLNKLPTLVDMAAPREPSRWPIYIGLVLVLLASALVLLAYSVRNAKPEAVRSLVGTSNVVAQEFQAERADSMRSRGGAQRPLPSDPSAFKDGSLRINVVSYSDDPSLRFAMVNGKLMREGEFAEPGVMIEKIQLNSVLFNARGKAIVLSPK